MNKNLKSILIGLLVLIGCIGIINNLDLDNLKDNSINTSESTSNSSVNLEEVSYLDLEASIYYQNHNDNSTKVRFICMYGGLDEKAYSTIKSLDFEIYDNNSKELISKSSVDKVYTGVVVNDKTIYASDYGYDYLVAYEYNITLNNSYKVVVNFNNDNGLFYRFTRVIDF